MEALNGTSKVSRRVWNRAEEDALVVELKKLVANGWRVDNAFRTGYLLALEHALAKKFPSAKITGNKHINSKLTVWKKSYKQLLGMFGTSGFRWEPGTKMITVDSDAIWDKYIKEHPDVESMRFKSFPFFPDWCEVFGNDGTNINNAQGFVDALQDLYSDKDKQETLPETDAQGFVDAVQDLHSGKGKQQASIEVSPVHHSFIDVVSEADDDARSVAQNDISGGSTKHHKSLKKGGPLSRKRKSNGTPDPMVGIMGDFLKDMNASCGDLLMKFNVDENVMAEKSKRLLAALGSIPGISDEAQVVVSYKLVNNPIVMELFLNMSQSLRSKFVQMMLEGKLS